MTVGVFDGVHRGHQKLINRTVERGRARGLPSVLVTFDPHPAEIIRPGRHPARLTSLRRRAELVAELGIDAFCVLPFTPELQRMEAAAFAYEVLVDRLHAAEVVVGRNFTFGHKAAGDVPMLTGLGARFGFGVEGLDLMTDDGVTVSSTYIRACIDAGDVAAATAALGRPHHIEGVVVHGEHRGRELGFPTANIATAEWTALPADGVYAGHFVLGCTAAAVGDLGGHQPDVLGQAAHARGVRPRRRRRLLRLRRRGGRRALAAQAGALSRHRGADGPNAHRRGAHPLAPRVMIFPNAHGRGRSAVSIGAWQTRCGPTGHGSASCTAPLGDRVRQLTARLGISQARLARALGISPAMLEPARQRPPRQDR